MGKQKETEFDKLARLIKMGDKDIRTELGGQNEKLAILTKEGFDDVRKEMRSGFARIDQELASIRAELKSIRADIASLQEVVGEHEGYTKEIDHVLKRVAAIERHLGIKHLASK